METNTEVMEQQVENVVEQQVETPEVQEVAKPAEINQIVNDPPVFSDALYPPEEVLKYTQENDKAPIVYESTGDDALDVVFEFIGKCGIKPTDIAIKRAMDGDFSIIEAKLAEMGDTAAGWERYVSIAKGVYEREKNSFETDAKAIADTIYAEVGGKEKWVDLMEACSAKVSKEQAQTINALLASNKLANAKVALAAMQYITGTGIMKTEDVSVETLGAMMTGAQEEPIDPAAFQEMMLAEYLKQRNYGFLTDPKTAPKWQDLHRRSKLNK